MQSISHKNLTWINIENPTAEDVLFLKEKFSIYPLFLDDFVLPSQRPKAEEAEGCLYVVSHIPLFDPQKRITVSGELDFILVDNHIITGHFGDNFPLKLIFDELKENSILREKAMSRSIGFLLYFILEKLLSSCFPKIDHINEHLSEIEKKIFEGFEKEMVREISIVKRDILAFRRTLKPQRTIIESLSQNNYQLLEKDLGQYFQELIGTNIRVWNALENTKEVIESLEETNNSIVSYSLNEAMRFLTAISLITFSLSVTTGIFSMQPFANFSAARQHETFWLIILFMSLISLGLLLFFKRKKWL